MNGKISDNAPQESSEVKLAILLCTCNGARYLEEQLESIFSQTHMNFEIHAADDCSQDDTIKILNRSKEKDRRLSTVYKNNKQKGFVRNFLSLVCDPHIQADYYAFSDQDDIWAPRKLEHATNWLADIPAEVPALYCSRTQLVDQSNKEIGFSPLFKKAPGFANALVQNIAGGNTMVFNDAARKILLSAGETVEVAAHDWWTYLAVSGCGGRVFYDPHPSIRYRQHSKNLIGMNVGIKNRFIRIRLLLQGQLRSWVDMNINALLGIRHQLARENLLALNVFLTGRDSWGLLRLLRVRRSGIYRQTLGGNLGLVLAAALKKL